MKKIITYLSGAALAMLLLSACTSDDNTNTPEPQPTNQLLGKWQLNTLSIKSFENGEIVSEYTDVPVAGNMTWEYDFKADNTVEYYMSVPANQIEEQGTGMYTVNGNVLTLTIEGEPAIFNVLNLDGTNLHLKITEEQEYEGILYKDEIEQKFIKN